MRIRDMAPVLLALALLVGGCARGTPPGSSPSPTAVPATPTPTPRTFGCEKATGGNKDATMYLTDVEIGVHDGYDRIVFEFVPREGREASVPYWEVGPSEPPLRQDGSGNEMQVEGDNFLTTIMWASGVDLSGPEYREVYEGPDRFTPDNTASVQEVAKAGDFENVLTWHVGLSGPACFEVTELSDPVRIVLDVQG